MVRFWYCAKMRLDKGLSDEQIFQELGTAKEAAAVLNEQMKEYTYRKSPWRYLFLVPLLFGAWELIGNLWASLIYLMLPDPFLSVGEAATIGVIGGADGPTAIFITRPDWVPGMAAILMILIGVAGFYKLSRCKWK